MKKHSISVVLLLAIAVPLLAKEARYYSRGLLMEMTSVECGYNEKSGKGWTGAVLGTDSAKRETRAMLCQEYVLRGERVIYRIRPQEEKKPQLLPVGEEVEFRIKKDRLLLRIMDGDKNKELKYIVVSMTPREVEQPRAAAAAAPAKPE